MIEFAKSYKTSDGKLVATIQEAQLHELALLFNRDFNNPLGGDQKEADISAKLVLENKDIIIDILTTNPSSKPKARAIHGGTKKRKTVITNASTPVNSTSNI